MDGDADIFVPASLLGDPARVRLLMALADGRALPASMLAAEVSVAASTASQHLARLRDAGMLAVQAHGRHRYYRITDPRVVRAMEALAEISPTAPVRSLRQGTRASALRRGRLCYDHLAGQLGVALMAALTDGGAIEGGDGLHHPEDAPTDRLSAPGHGADLLRGFGVDLGALHARGRSLIRYCLDWTEQRHQLAGSLGAAIGDRLLELGWIRRSRTSRAVQLTDAGTAGLATTFGVHPENTSVTSASTASP